ncbi:MAG: DUF2206 domain-containing protein [Methanomassiliicoccus sp.]|nr:DUF2206 domain-containing protein [Methanomassiliicoccus sp.]
MSNGAKGSGSDTTVHRAVPVRTLILVVLSLELSLFGIIVIGSMGLWVQPAQQVLGLVCFLVVPGLLLLCVLRSEEHGVIKTALLALGLSIAILMAEGLVLNTILPILGIERPLTLVPISIGQVAIVLLLCLVLYTRPGHAPIRFSFARLSTREALISLTVIIALPAVAILAVTLFNDYGDNLVQMLLLLAVAVLILLSSARRWIPERAYPFLIFALSLALLLHTSLVTSYLWGWDVHKEYFFSRSVIDNGFWDMSFYSNVNAMLSITMVAPLLSIVSAIDLLTIFKLVFPLVFALVPVVMFFVFRTRWDARISLLAALLLISYFSFYLDMPWLGRQQIAELFLALMLLVSFDADFRSTTKVFLFTVFAAGLVVSHYGTTYVVLLCLVLSFILLNLSRVGRYILGARDGRGFLRYMWTQPSNIFLLRSGTVLLFFLLAWFWYFYASSSSAFDTIVHLGNQIITAIYDDTLGPGAVQGADYLLGATSTKLHDVGKIVQLMTQALIGLGLVMFVWKDRKRPTDHYFLSIAFFVVLVAALTVPYFSNALNTSRLYQICLLILSPFAILAAVVGSEWLFGLGRGRSRVDGHKVVALFIALFLVFSSGFIYELANDETTNMALDKNMDFPRYTDPEVMGALWLHSFADPDQYRYGDEFGVELLWGYGPTTASGLPYSYASLADGSYIVMGPYNLRHDAVFDGNEYFPVWPYTNPSNHIYSSLHSSIYLK